MNHARLLLITDEAASVGAYCEKQLVEMRKMETTENEFSVYSNQAGYSKPLRHDSSGSGHSKAQLVLSVRRFVHLATLNFCHDAKRPPPSASAMIRPKTPFPPFLRVPKFHRSRCVSDSAGSSRSEREASRNNIWHPYGPTRRAGLRQWWPRENDIRRRDSGVSKDVGFQIRVPRRVVALSQAGATCVLTTVRQTVAAVHGCEEDTVGKGVFEV
ncbi:hypothetical protein HPB50_005991 [Hyalomma asiaticum]|uniref:Uncharacterized protein n=1 Tax=Hyalomma asiaticum TaxID=266040 RepID=A0ACB7S5Q3_HYAAI|nr:hypothetical protein HPB50_005991 [Hyalomma asiaticum]